MCTDFRAQKKADQHRVHESGAVLAVVNALRSASTRPVAGPSGIDDASAQHGLGSYAMLALPGCGRRLDPSAGTRG
jgi:hypothetical protein